MILAILIGLIVGFVLAIPPGPIGMAAIRTGIRQGSRAASKLALGAGLFDVIYCALAMMATSAVVDKLNSMEASSPLLTLIIQLVIVVAMIGFGLVQLRDKHLPIAAEEEKGDDATKKNLMERLKGHGPFFIGVGFAIANLANPTFIPSLAAMSTFIQKLDLFESRMVNDLAFSLGFGAGNMLWLLVVVRLVLHYKERMTPTFITRIQQCTGVTLIGFGTFYGARILYLTKWAQVLSLVMAL